MTRSHAYDEEEYEERRFPIRLRRPTFTRDAVMGALLGVVGAAVIVALVELFLRKGGV